MWIGLYNNARCDIGCLTTVLYMLLYSMSWTSRHDSSPPACSKPNHPPLDSFITLQVHDITIVMIRLESPLHPAPYPLPSRLLRFRQLAAAIAEDHCSCLQQQPVQAATQVLQLMSNLAAPFFWKRVCAKQHEAGGNLLYPGLSLCTMHLLKFWLAILLLSMFQASMIS